MPSHETMPKVLDPPLTTRQVRQHATAALPGARVRRLVFWGYLLLWHRLIEGTGGHRPVPARNAAASARRTVAGNGVTHLSERRLMRISWSNRTC